eukprot:Pgem_evm1s14579
MTSTINNETRSNSPYNQNIEILQKKYERLGNEYNKLKTVNTTLKAGLIKSRKQLHDQTCEVRKGIGDNDLQELARYFHDQISNHQHHNQNINKNIFELKDSCYRKTKLLNSSLCVK